MDGAPPPEPALGQPLRDGPARRAHHGRGDREGRALMGSLGEMRWTGREGMERVGGGGGVSWEDESRLSIHRANVYRLISALCCA